MEYPNPILTLSLLHPTEPRYLIERYVTADSLLTQIGDTLFVINYRGMEYLATMSWSRE